MASVKPYKDGWRAWVYVQGHRESATFRTRREAAAWGARRESELRESSTGPAGERVTLGETLARYAAEVSPTKRGVRWEQLRLARFARDDQFPTHERIASVTPEMIAAWRDDRSKRVGRSTVIRELGLLSAVFDHARREWRLVPSNPVGDVRKPKQPDHREVVISRAQIRAMLRSLGYSSTGRVSQTRQAVAMAFLLALRAGMRAGELCGLTWDRVKADHCELPVTKTVPRDVPLVPQAIRVIERMRGWDDTTVFGLTPATLDAMFRKYRKRAGLEGFTFHDARHTAATRIAQKVDVLTLCKIFGWSSTKHALVYVNPTASEIAARLSRR